MAATILEKKTLTDTGIDRNTEHNFIVLYLPLFSYEGKIKRLWSIENWIGVVFISLFHFHPLRDGKVLEWRNATSLVDKEKRGFGKRQNRLKK